MSLTLFLMALDCQYFSVPSGSVGYNQEFPQYYCWTMPHLINAGVGAAAVILFGVLASFFSAGEMEVSLREPGQLPQSQTGVPRTRMAVTCPQLNFTTKNMLAIMHTSVELETFIVRLTMVRELCLSQGLWRHVMVLSRTGLCLGVHQLAQMELCDSDHPRRPTRVPHHPLAAPVVLVGEQRARGVVCLDRLVRRPLHPVGFPAR
jgi:hypothetical protein